MNEKLKKMLDKINGLKAQVKDLVDAGKLEDAAAKKKELIEAATSPTTSPGAWRRATASTTWPCIP